MMGFDIGSLSGMPNQHSFLQNNRGSSAFDNASIKTANGHCDLSQSAGPKRNVLRKKQFPIDRMPDVKGSNAILTRYNLAHHDLLNRLFPSGIQNCNFKQGNVGDCVFLAGLKATMQNNPQEIAQIIRPGRKEGEFVVHFNGRKPVILKENEFKRMGVAGDPGVQALERAYGESQKIIIGQSTRKCLDGLSEKPVLRALNMGGKTTELCGKTKTRWPGLKNLFHRGSLAKQESFSDMSSKRLTKLDRLLDDVGKNPGKNIAIVSRGHDNLAPEYLAKGIASEHAYSLVHADHKNVTIINPWNSAQTIYMSRNDFKKEFSNITMIKK